MKKTRFFCKVMVFLLLITISSASMVVTAEDEIKVKLNGVQLEFDVPPQIIGDRTMVPVRKIFEALGAQVDWNETEQIITAQKKDTKIILQIDNSITFIGANSITLDVPPQLVDGRTLVPVRAVSEAFNTEVTWDGETKTVMITDKPADSSGKSYSFIDVGEGIEKALLADDGSWRIMIPDTFDEVAVEDGNNIFSNETTQEIIYIQIRNMEGVKDSFDTLAKELVEDRLNTPMNGMTYKTEKDITKETLNELEYYTSTIKLEMNGAAYYSYLYFVIWDDQLFEFCCSTPRDTILPAFQEVLKSFNPKNAE